MDIGKGIKKLRKSFNLNQENFAIKTGISQTYVSDLENNRKNPTINTMKQILEPFNVEYVDFLIDYCGYKRIKNDEEAEEQALFNSKNENDSLQQFFSTFVDISEIKGFELDGNPLDDKEQTALFSLITLIKTNKEKEEKLFVQLQEQNNKDNTDKP